jgi:hypothetical protein
MKALTLRNLRPELARAIERKAQVSGTSLSGAVVALLEQAAGLSKPRRTEHHDFDRFAGSWTAGQAREFDKAPARSRVVDKELWE